MDADTYPRFCCDGAGMGAGHDPWCDRAAPEQQVWFAQLFHLGTLDASVYPLGSAGCDDERCCGEDEP